MIVGTVAWTIAFVVLLPFLERLNDAGRGWWVWTCLAGVGLGLFGVEYCRRRRDARSAARDDRGRAGTDEAPPYEPLT